MDPSWLLDPRNGPAFDLPPHPDRRTWVMASLPRTGSTLLCRLLDATGAAGAPKEYLNPMQIRDWEARLAPGWLTRARHAALAGPLVPLAGKGPWTEARLAAYLARVQARRTGPNGWFGLKIHWHHFARWFADHPGRLERVMPVTAWVVLRRRDKVAQAVSWYRAMQTGSWVAGQRPWMPPVYDAGAIGRRVTAIVHGEAAWDTWFAAHHVTPLRLWYEDVIADTHAATRQVLDLLGAPADVPIPPPMMQRQADATSEQWIARFRAEGPVRR